LGEHLSLELRFDQIATNKKDLDYLYSHFTGKPNAKLPNVVNLAMSILAAGLQVYKTILWLWYI
jgi:hypothetical protein